MQKPFHDLRIVELLDERCHVVEAPVLRIYLRLSEMPPLGWAYLFSVAWQSADYPGKRAAGIEGDALWIECAPGEVISLHLPELEKAVAQANAQARSVMQRKAEAEQRQRELENQIQADLEELGRSLNPGRSAHARKNPPPPRIQSLWGMLKQVLGVRETKEQGRRNRDHANHFCAEAGAGWRCQFAEEPLE